MLILVRGRDAAAEGDGAAGDAAESGTGPLLPGERLLQLVWDAMVLLYGKEDLLNIRNVERFKREIKVRFVGGCCGVFTRSHAQTRWCLVFV